MKVKLVRRGNIDCATVVGRTKLLPATIRSEPCKMAKNRIGVGASTDL